jgi:short-chain fatty acids transporter
MTLRETTPPDAFERTGVVARMALALTAWTERWVPDAFVFALVGTIIVVIAGTAATPSSLAQVIDAWGSGFWELIPFTLQMSLIIITGHVLATSAPMSRLIRVLAAQPRTPKSAVAMVALFAMASSWFNWGFSLVFSAVLAREVARRQDGVDYRALAAASFLGLGSIWAQGISGSAALQMATAGALQPQIRDIISKRRHRPGGDHHVPPYCVLVAEPRLGRGRDDRRDPRHVARHAAGRQGTHCA